MAYFDPKRFPTVSAFLRLRKDKRRQVIETNRREGFEKAVDQLVVLEAAGYARGQKPT